MAPVPLLAIIITSITSVLEILLEMCVGFVVVRFKIIPLQASKILMPAIGFVVAQVFFPAFYIINISKTIDLELLKRVWPLIILGGMIHITGFLIGMLFWFLTVPIIVLWRVLAYKICTLDKILYGLKYDEDSGMRMVENEKKWADMPWSERIQRMYNDEKLWGRLSTVHKKAFVINVMFMNGGVFPIIYTSAIMMQQSIFPKDNAKYVERVYAYTAMLSLVSPSFLFTFGLWFVNSKSPNFSPSDICMRPLIYFLKKYEQKRIENPRFHQNNKKRQVFAQEDRKKALKAVDKQILAISIKILKNVVFTPTHIGITIGLCIALIPALKENIVTTPIPIVSSFYRGVKLFADAALALAMFLLGGNLALTAMKKKEKKIGANYQFFPKDSSTSNNIEINVNKNIVRKDESCIDMTKAQNDDNENDLSSEHQIHSSETLEMKTEVMDLDNNAPQMKKFDEKTTSSSEITCNSSISLVPLVPGGVQETEIPEIPFPTTTPATPGPGNRIISESNPKLTPILTNQYDFNTQLAKPLPMGEGDILPGTPPDAIQHGSDRFSAENMENHENSNNMNEKSLKDDTTLSGITQIEVEEKGFGTENSLDRLSGVNNLERMTNTISHNKTNSDSSQKLSQNDKDSRKVKFIQPSIPENSVAERLGISSSFSIIGESQLFMPQSTSAVNLVNEFTKEFQDSSPHITGSPVPLLSSGNPGAPTSDSPQSGIKPAINFAYSLKRNVFLFFNRFIVRFNHPLMLFCNMFAKLLVVPIIFTGIMEICLRLGIVPRDDPVFILLVLGNTAAAPAIANGILASLNNYAQNEISEILLWSYIASPITLAFLTVFYIQYVCAWTEKCVGNV